MKRGRRSNDDYDSIVIKIEMVYEMKAAQASGVSCSTRLKNEVLV